MNNDDVVATTKTEIIMPTFYGILNCFLNFIIIYRVVLQPKDNKYGSTWSGF